MRFVYVDAELAESLELLETLIGGECFLAIQLVTLIEVAVLLIDGARGNGDLATCHEEVDGRFGLVLPFQNDFLRIGDNQVEAGPVQDVERHTRLIQEVKADIGVKPADVLRWDDVGFSERLDLTKCLEY